MKIYNINVHAIENSRREKTIKIVVKTNYGEFSTSAPSGKSKGKYEVPAYTEDLRTEIKFLNQLKLSEILCFRDLLKVEKICKGKLGANSLFALEATLLKALAHKNGKELWQYLGRKNKKLPRPVGNAVGGGVHSKGVRKVKPDFQEFLFIPDAKTFKECVRINNKAYKFTRKYLKSKERNDEGAWETGMNNKEVLEIMNKVKEKIWDKYKEKIVIGVDVAASSFYQKSKYLYQNPVQNLNKEKQIEYIKALINQYNIYYIEDPLNEDDFSGFKILNKGRCFIVGDDLTVTNLQRLKRAVKMKAIRMIIIKPNQIGSLIKTKEVIDFAHKNKIKTIMSHRSGETEDDTIADISVGWGCDFIKTGIYGKEREAKLNRIIEIEKSLR
jgi:enolase